MLKEIANLIVVLLFVLSCSVQKGHARRNTITGGLVFSYDYNKINNERSTSEAVSSDGEQPLENDQQPLEKFILTPLLTLETTSHRDNLTISLNPNFVYDQASDQYDIENNFKISAYRLFSRKFRFDLSNSFIYSDDPELIEDGKDSPSFDQSRKRYNVNNLEWTATYTYDADSLIAAGYRYEVLRNEETGPGGYEDYDRHNPTFSLQHRFSPFWNVNVMCGYTRGLFVPPAPAVIEDVGDEDVGGEDAGGDSQDNDLVSIDDGDNNSNDLAEYRFTPRVDYILSQRNTFWLSYNYTLINYDALLRANTSLNEVTLGSEYHHTRRLTFEFDGGPSYEQTDDFDSRWGYNAHVGFHYELDRNSDVIASVVKGYDEQSFSPKNDLLGQSQGFASFWELKMSLAHEFDAGFTGTAFFLYRDEYQEMPFNSISGTPDADIDRETLREENIFNRKIYEGGCSLGYNFLRWYSMALNYTYSKQDAELLKDRYDEHRVYLTFSVKKELLRW